VLMPANQRSAANQPSAANRGLGVDKTRIKSVDGMTAGR
jgi:hypothetical protein